MDIGNLRLIEAVRKGRLEEVKELIQAGANPDSFLENLNWTALMNAASCGESEIINVLIQARADLEKVDCWGATALMIAAQYGHTNIINLLYQAGANVGAVDKFGHTALSQAIKENHLDAANLLFSTMSNEQIQQQINYHPDIDIQTNFDLFKQAVFKAYMGKVKNFEYVLLEGRADNLLSLLPNELIPSIGLNCYKKAWHDLYLEPKASLTFSPVAGSYKRKALNEQSEPERDIKDASEEEMHIEESSYYKP